MGEPQCSLCSKHLPVRKDRIDIYGQSKLGKSYRESVELFVHKKYHQQFQDMDPIRPGQSVYFCKQCGGQLTGWQACKTTQMKLEQELQNKPLFRAQPVRISTEHLHSVPQGPIPGEISQNRVTTAAAEERIRSYQAKHDTAEVRNRTVLF